MDDELIRVSFNLNGEEKTLDVPWNISLLHILRDFLNLTGTKCGCEIGECGACSILMNGEAVLSCLIIAGKIDGATIVTVEGLSENGILSILQKAFIENHAVQCGFCTPGMLISATALLQRNPSPNEMEIKLALSGNICRCTGYTNIIDAVRAASESQS
jgi:carbon-monoxide dehydrogenase small subunit